MICVVFVCYLVVELVFVVMFVDKVCVCVFCMLCVCCGWLFVVFDVV